jgi:hypothetical protein
MPALLNVTYTPNYIGSHRICFRTTQPSYCCYLDDSASVIGVPKTTVIDLDEFETCLQDLPSQVGCGDTPLDGYIQPFCVDQGSDLNRVSFTADFPSTPCQPYSVECQVSSVAEIQVSDPGYGWLPGDVPTVTITDLSGYGSGATAEAVMACNDSNICFVESITIIDPGESYYLINQIVVDISLPTDPGGTPAQAQVTALDDCGTFTVPNCDGTDNPTEYELWGGPQYAINVCAGGAGPQAFKYIVTPNPTYDGLGPELLLNNTFETSVDDWTQDFSPSVTWSSNYGGSAQFNVADSVGGISQDILTIGQEYTVDIDLTIIFDGSCTPELESFTSFTIFAGTAVYGPLNFSGSQSFSFNITCTDNTIFRIEAWDPEGCTSNDLLDPQMYCSYVSVKGVGVPIPVSCCDCVKYEVINTALTEAREFYYTSCQDQSIVTGSVDPQDTITICAVPGSFWVQNPDDNQYVEFVVSAIQDC